jgi:hypothetical protein
MHLYQYASAYVCISTQAENSVSESQTSGLNKATRHDARKNLRDQAVNMIVPCFPNQGLGFSADNEIVAFGRTACMYICTCKWFTRTCHCSPKWRQCRMLPNPALLNTFVTNHHHCFKLDDGYTVWPSLRRLCHCPPRAILGGSTAIPLSPWLPTST